MKKIVSITVSIIIVVLLTLFIVLPKKNFSSNENRFLEKFPSINIESIFDGSFMSDFESFVEDHFPFREFFLNLKTNAFKLSGITKQSDVYFGKDGYLLQEFNEPESMDKIIKIVNRFKDSNENINMSFLLAPTSIYINKSKLPSNVTYDEGKVIEYYKENLNVDFIDVKDKLLENNKEYLYYKTDHHWTTKGAYYAYLVYCEEKGLTPFEYEYELVNDDFYGTLYSKVIDNSLDKDSIHKVVDDSEYVVYYKTKDETKESMYEESYLKEKDKYSYFLDNNHALITITNKSIKSNNEILIIKDSYANSFIPLISKHYKKIHVIDPRYYKTSISEYIKENKIKDVLFLYNVLTLDSDMGIVSVR